VLGGLYWGDNVVWQLDAAPVEPFYSAIAGLSDAFETRTFVSMGSAVDAFDVTGLAVIGAGPGSDLAQPADLLREIHRISHPRARRLLLFESLDSMVRAWGASNTRGFFARCCPMLLEVGAIAYWSMSARDTPSTVRDTVEAVTQCVLRVDERSVRVSKAEGRDEGVRGSVLHWHEEEGRPVLAPAELVGRVAASLRAVRRARELSQHDLAGLAGVTASAISQAERAERGLSLATLVRLSSALGVTIDDLLRGEDPDVYRIGRRTEDPQLGPEHTMTLLGSADSDLRVDLVHLDAREAGAPTGNQKGTGIVAVASGLVQVQVAGQTPAVRHGEVLVADSDRVQGWRNLGQTETVLFWIVVSPADPRQLRRSA
jgi:transcriptional regulator with XRE-family HTH domain